jgi:hypothetical protein
MTMGKPINAAVAGCELRTTEKFGLTSNPTGTTKAYMREFLAYFGVVGTIAVLLWKEMVELG